MERRPVPHLSGRKLLAHGTAYLANCTVITGASLVSGVTRQDTTLRPASDFSPASLLCMSTLASVRIVNVPRSEEHTSELQSLMRISYAVFCLKKKTIYFKHTFKSPYTLTI